MAWTTATKIALGLYLREWHHKMTRCLWVCTLSRRGKLVVVTACFIFILGGKPGCTLVGGFSARGLHHMGNRKVRGTHAHSFFCSRSMDEGSWIGRWKGNRSRGIPTTAANVAIEGREMIFFFLSACILPCLILSILGFSIAQG